ncbi:MAG: hypothetical protein ACOX7J_06470 [Bacillota bacterium]|jgi:hypothetical protein
MSNRLQSDSVLVYCRICGRPFRTRTPWDKVCGAECRAENERRIYEERRSRNIPPGGKAQLADWDWPLERMRIDLQTDNAVKDAYAKYRKEGEAAAKKYSQMRTAETERHKAVINAIRSAGTAEIRTLYREYQERKKHLLREQARRKLESYKRLYKPLGRVSDRDEYKRLRYAFKKYEKGDTK